MLPIVALVSAASRAAWLRSEEHLGLKSHVRLVLRQDQGTTRPLVERLDRDAP